MPRAAITPLPNPVFDEPVFNEGVPTPDPTGFKTKHTSDTATYASIKKLQTKDVVSFDAARGQPGDLFTLAEAYGAQGPGIVKTIQKNKKIVFHSLGDSGSSNAGTYKDEIKVSDLLTADCQTSEITDRPAFLFHLGDVVYAFGESKYYYDQFYEPFRNYPAPIFAIPGNHDSFVLPNTPADSTPLTIFARNFCSATPVITSEAASLHRTAMTQPGVYFTLDAPFVRIIGLFSNALEDPGVISNQDGKWPAVPNVQIDYLTAQLQQIKKQNYKGAVLLAVHHPPFSYAPPPKAPGSGGNHGSSTPMLGQIDTICKATGVYPHAILSGHAHNYQRYTRTVNFIPGKDPFDVPFIICGDGGHHVNKLVQGKKGQPSQEPSNGQDVSYLDKNPTIKTGGLLLEHYDDTNYGYLRLSVDADQLQIGFHTVATTSLPQSRVDMVTVDLASHTMVSN